MKLLRIGGTVFLGRHITDSLLASGQEVTLFHRGVNVSPRRLDVEIINGDRIDAQQLRAVAGRYWDSVVNRGRGLPAENQPRREMARFRRMVEPDVQLAQLAFDHE